MSDASEQVKGQVAGLKWMFEMELLDEKNPAPINVLKLNVLMVSPRIREVEFLTFREGRQMLVLLDLTWIGRKFYKKQIFTEVHEVLTQMLPAFRFRVTADPKIMEMALEKVKKLLGDMNEIRNKPDTNDKSDDGDSSPKQLDNLVTGSTVVQGAVTNIKADSEEQQRLDETVRTEGVNSDSTKRS